jgi:tetratricopeptide (TPR) repeat protein
MIMKRISIFLFPLLCSTMLFAAEEDVRKFRALLEEGLFQSAEDFCNEKFNQSDLSEIEKIQLATELAAAYSQQLAEPTQRASIVKRLENLETIWLQGEMGQSDPELALAKIMLRLQCAMTYRSLGEHQRFEAEAASETNKRTAYLQAQTTLQGVMDRLKKCQKERQALQQRTDILLRQKVLALEFAITKQQGLTQKSLALTLPTVEERNLELQNAITTFTELVAQNSTGFAIVQCKIEAATCYRLRGELDRCAEILNTLRGNLAALTPECRLQTEAEWIRYNIAKGNITEMRRQYTTDRADVKLYPDFDLARLELFLVNDPTKNIRAEMNKVMQLEQAISRQFGSHWARRAGRIVVSSGISDFNSAEMLATRAEQHYQDKQFIDSADLYEQAAAKADVNGQAENMFRYNRLAVRSWWSALEQLPPGTPKREYQSRFIVIVQRVVSQNPNYPEALELHLSAIDTQKAIVLSKPEALDDFLELVKEHETYWNDSPKLQDLYCLSIIFLERQGRIDETKALLPLLDADQLASLTPEIQRIRVRQLDAEGKTQEAINMLAALLKQKREPATLQLIAAILTRQTDEKGLNLALDFWGQLEHNTQRDSEMWWSAREGILEVLIKLNRREDAKKSFDMLRTLYPELGGAEHKARLLKLLVEEK